MKHPFDELRPGIEADLAAMKIRPDRIVDFDRAAGKLIRLYQAGQYADVPAATGVPAAWIAASFEREASSNFSRSPAQGDPWDRASVHVPKNRGPFSSWAAAAKDAYHLDGLDRIGAQNWTWALAYYYAELFNGFGYRDWHHMRSPYVLGGTNLQARGKYTADGGFDSTVMDQQLGVIPLMMRMAELCPALTLPGAWPFPEPTQVVASPPIVPTQTSLASFDVKAVQRALNARGFGPLLEDGSFGRKTSAALRAFESSAGLTADGLLDRATVDRLLAA
ncbi:MAG TPA: peptidoglycan-binding protein [Gaiellaceae bacterium]